MDFPFHGKALNSLATLGKARSLETPLAFKLGQQIEAKVIQTTLTSNILNLQLGKTVVQAQLQIAQPQKHQSPESNSQIVKGQQLKLQVTKLTPEPEFTIEKVTSPPELKKQLQKTLYKKNLGLIGKSESNHITLKLINKQESILEGASKPVTNRLQALQVGQKIPARTISISNKQIQFQLLVDNKNMPSDKPHSPRPLITINTSSKDNIPQNHFFQKADFPKPQILVGQSVLLEVTSTGDTPQFKIFDSKPLTLATEKIISETIKKQLPIQQSPELFIHQLITSLPVLKNSPSIPETLKNLAQQILHNLPKQSQLTQPQSIKRSIKNSGLFLESSLALQDNHSELNTPADFKANVLKFIQLLKQTSVTIPQQEADNLRQETLSLKQLQSTSENSMAKLVLDQLNSLPKEDNPKQNWYLELPYISQKNAQTISFDIETNHKKNTDSGTENWSVSITLTPTKLGRLQCKITCIDEKINTHFWTGSEQVTNLINNHMGHLKAQIESAGLDAGHMESFLDIPKNHQISAKLSSQLIDEKI